MKIAVRGGHNFSVPGAHGIIDETTEDRKVKDAVIKYLKLLGHTVLDVTPSDSYNTVSSDLVYGVNKANNFNADLFISIHFNNAYTRYNGSLGTEILVNNLSRNNSSAKGILNALTSLGFTNRGVKERSGLYELHATNMTSVIVETCFVEATEDVKLYRSLGADVIGKAIAEGALNSKVPTNPVPPSKPTPTPSKPNLTPAKPISTPSNWITDLQKELNRNFNGNLTVDGVAGSKTLNACPALMFGVRGKILEIIQKRLNSLNFNCGLPDGVFGNNTKTALIAFQKAKGLIADGIIGNLTWRKLLNL